MKPDNELSDRETSLSTWVEEVVRVAVDAARVAGAIQMRHFRSKRLNHTRLLHDVKLETDRLCETSIVAKIRDRFPDHIILTEESGRLPGIGDVLWIIDPLDGTVNFWHGIPFFCVSIACYHVASPLTASDVEASLPSDFLADPIAGVVLLPYTDELFVGIAGKGAFVNGRSIAVNPISESLEALVTVSFGKTSAVMNRMTARVRTLLPKVRKVRCLGAVAAELCYSACGFLDGIFYDGIKPWDFAAGNIILEEAGGFLEAMETAPGNWRVYAGAPAMRVGFEALLQA